MDVRTAIEQRRSVHSYDPDKKLTDEQITELIRLSILAPSSFNLNHWRFIVVTSEEGKKKLHDASLNQRHILDASAVLVVLGKIDAHEDMPQFTSDWIEKGYYPDDEHLMKVSKGFYGSDPTKQRDEAIRSTSIMVGMMMLAAKEMGLDTAAIIGFRPPALREAVQIPDNYEPVMMLTVGYELTPPPERVQRLQPEQIMYRERFGDPFFPDVEE